MPYQPTQEQLIEDFQLYYLADPVLWDQPCGTICWWGKVVAFQRLDVDEMALEIEGQSITFLLP